MALQPPMPPMPQPMGAPPPGAPKIPAPPMVPGAPGAPTMAKAMPVPQPGGARPGPGQPGAQPGAGEEDDLQPHLSFWQQPWVQNVLPFITSLVFHAAIVVIVVLIGLTVQKVAQHMHTEEQTIIPESTMADAGPPGGVPNVGTGGDPFKQAMQDKFPDQGSAEGWASKPGPIDAAVTAEGGGAGEGESSGLIGLGAGGLGKGGGSGAGGGNGSGGGTGDGSGPLAMFGTPGGGAIGPKGPVFGNGGNARKIIFVCDASGSMISKMASLKNELSKAVQGLKPIQQFNIIFFQDQRALALDNESMVAATPDNKRKAYKFLDDVTTSSTSDPLPGLAKAFKQAPQLIYILTDGDFPDNAAVAAEIKKLNVGNKVKVNTIAFVNDKDTDTEFIPLLQGIAKDSGGTFKHVAENELNQ